VTITHRLGGNFTVMTLQGMYRIAAKDADALGENEGGSTERNQSDDHLSEPAGVKEIKENLKSVFDPEIPVNVVDLGLIYRIEIEERKDKGRIAFVDLTLTAPGCGMGPVIAEDVKGKVLSLNSIGSTSGDLIPQVELVKINLSTTNKDHFKNVFYAGSHDACLLAVLNKQSDVCGMSSRNFEARLADSTFKIEQIRIIHKSDAVPPPPLAYSKRIPLEDRKKIKKAVLEAHIHGKIGGYGGKMSHYISVQDSDYNVLRKVVALLKKNK
jgi:metal-sulfur cluster biosynthetic enzyme